MGQIIVDAALIELVDIQIQNATYIFLPRDGIMPSSAMNSKLGYSPATDFVSGWIEKFYNDSVVLRLLLTSCKEDWK